MATVTIEIEDALKRSLEERLAAEGMTLEDVVLRAVQGWALGQEKPNASFTSEELAALLAAQAELDSGQGIAHEAVMADVRARYRG